MATIIHLGDCLSGCDICTDNYHDEQFMECETCGAEL